MAADLHIHIFRGVTEEDLADFFSSSMGSKWFEIDRACARDRREGLFEDVADTPNIWIGEVSWLKAAFCEDPDTFIPGPVMQISNLIGEDLPILNDKLINKIVEALKTENATSYEIAPSDSVEEFLNQYKGQKVFTVSW